MTDKTRIADLPEFDMAAALGDIARARGMTEIAKASGITREALYKALRPGGSATIRYDSAGLSCPGGQTGGPTGAGLNRAGVFSLTGTIRIVDTPTRAFTPSSTAVNRPNTRPRFLWGFPGICSRSAHSENPLAYHLGALPRNSTGS